MSKIKQLPVDMATWKLLGYNQDYYVPINPSLKTVANSAIKFYENRLKQPNLTEENRDILKESISRIRDLVNYKI